VAQHTIQQFLREYQGLRRVTILLTSHYMKDVAALCRRVVIIAAGRIIYDGPLEGITGRFSGQKVLSLLFADGERPVGLEQLGEVLESHPPKLRLRVPRGEVTRVLTHIFAHCAVQDVSVEDPPLEAVIAEVFSRS